MVLTTTTTRPHAHPAPPSPPILCRPWARSRSTIDGASLSMTDWWPLAGRARRRTQLHPSTRLRGCQSEQDTHPSLRCIFGGSISQRARDRLLTPSSPSPLQNSHDRQGSDDLLAQTPTHRWRWTQSALSAVCGIKDPWRLWRRGGSGAERGDGQWGCEGALDQRASPPGDRRRRGRTAAAAAATAATECIMVASLLPSSPYFS